ncbi:MAG: AraC family transcriptional regulator [Clostridiales bacterium]|nr:AraC family transcriptional regulator [Clostridiales bacterium]
MDNRSTFQPYLEFNNCYKNFSPEPNNPISKVVWEIYQVDHFDCQKNIALPDVCADIMVFYTDNNIYSYIMTSSDSMQFMNELDFLPDVNCIFGVRLKTGYIGNLFKYAIEDIGNSRIDLANACYYGNDINEKLYHADDFAKRYSIIAEYINQRLNSTYRNNIIVTHIIDEIINHHGTITIKELEHQIGYSGRYLRMLIHDTLGVSIKQFCKLTQFQWMCQCYNSGGEEISLSELALLSGYYDQSHMNQCCKMLTGQLPKNIVHLYQDCQA